MDRIVVEKDVPCRMRDGTVLYANVYRPAENGKFPVLLTRHPYGKDFPRFSHQYVDPLRLAQHGYVVIVQDVRGRWKSEGTFAPFKQEADDGFDAVEWAAGLPYSSGQVGMFGMSYHGYTQLCAASRKPPHLRAIFPAMSFHDLREGLWFRGGAFELAMAETWFLESIVPNELERNCRDGAELADKMRRWEEALDNIGAWHAYAPIDRWPPLKGDFAGLPISGRFFEMLSRAPDDEYWERLSLAGKLHGSGIPAFFLGGWYDCFLGSTIACYTEMRSSARLMIGPWDHSLSAPVVGERNFGFRSGADRVGGREDLTSLHLRWFDYWLKGRDTGIMSGAPVKLFVMGINKWRDEYEWPLARTVYTPFYLRSGGRAGGRFGDGRLSPGMPGREPPDEFVYDPQHPVPTLGGATLFAGGRNMGPRDQSGLEEREDVLVYTSEPLERPLEVTGPVKVKLWVSTDAPDTDFSAKLVDVAPDGKAWNLTDGIVRLKYRNGFKPERPLKGETVLCEIDLWATSNVFLPGHRIRLEISSSNFPRFDRNPNTGETTVRSDVMRRARQRVFHTGEFPSHVLLPVIPDA